MLQISIPKKYNQKCKYEEDFKLFHKTSSGYYYYRNYEEDITEELIKKIKKNYNFPNFYIYLSEKGGLDKEPQKSYVRIVCDYEGGKVMPIKKITYGYRANMEHAFFIGNDLCEVELYIEDHSYKYRITHHTIDKKNGEYNKEILYEGKLKHRITMPRKLKRFDAAIDAASKKIADYQCIDIYYSL